MSNDITLVVMAAGMGSRFGGLKQMEPIGPNGEVILDFSVFDAVEAGFTKVVFVIKHAIEADFKEMVGKRIAKKVKVEYYTTLNEATTVMGDNIYNDVTLDYSTAATSGSDKLKVDKENNIDERPYVYTGGYKFKKTSINGTTVLEGAVFDVLNANGDVIAELTSDEYGIFEIKGLKNGAYSLVETKAPEGHELLTAPIEFTISKGSYDADITVVKNIPTSKLPLTGGMGTALFTCIGFVLIGMGAVLFFASRKKKSN